MLHPASLWCHISEADLVVSRIDKRKGKAGYPYNRFSFGKEIGHSDFAVSIFQLASRDSSSRRWSAACVDWQYTCDRLRLNQLDGIAGCLNLISLL